MDSDNFGLPPLEEVLGRDKEKGSSDDGGLGSVSLPPLGEILGAYDEGNEDCSSGDIDYFTGTNADDAESFYSNRGFAKFRTSDYRSSLAYFKAALAIDPISPAAHDNIIRAQEKLGNVKEVEYHRMWSKRLDPGRVIGDSTSYRDSSYQRRRDLWKDWKNEAKRLFGGGNNEF